jgi:cation diffusion facilitator CzcD-associated flavoprotein CzcO
VKERLEVDLESDQNKSPDFDAIVIGAGVSGLYALYRLRELGLRVRAFETGEGVGGVWYWNRYPGCRFDSESWTYCYSFSQDLLDEWDWAEHFSAQPDTERYLNYVADKFDLRRHIQFNSRVVVANWDDRSRVWDVSLENGQSYTTRWFVPALGLLSAAASTLPNIPGVETFEGQSFHTSHWPKEPVSFEGKRVAVIGTASSGVQVIQEVAKTASQLTVFQRTPQWCMPLGNSAIDAEEMARIRTDYSRIFSRCQQTDGCYIHTSDPRNTFEVTPEIRKDFWEGLYNQRGMAIWLGNFCDVLSNRDANNELSAFLAEKIRARVDDPALADKLIPNDHGFGTRRVVFETNYYEVYNQPNVTLVDAKATPIERVTRTGIATSVAEFEFDMIVYATGFEAFTGALERVDIHGLNGLTLRQKWEDGPRTFLGFIVDGFPNMLILLGPHAGVGNVPRAAEYSADWLVELVRFARGRSLTRVEATQAGVQDWTDEVIAASEGLLYLDVDSWMTGINRNVETKKQVRQVVRYAGGHPAFRRRADAEAAANYPALSFD